MKRGLVPLVPVQTSPVPEPSAAPVPTLPLAPPPLPPCRVEASTSSCGYAAAADERGDGPRNGGGATGGEGASDGDGAAPKPLGRATTFDMQTCAVSQLQELSVLCGEDPIEILSEVASPLEQTAPTL